MLPIVPESLRLINNNTSSKPPLHSTVLGPLFDWSSVASPTPLVPNSRTATPQVPNQSTARPYEPTYTPLPASTVFMTPSFPQTSPPTFFVQHHSVSAALMGQVSIHSPMPIHPPMLQSQSPIPSAPLIPNHTSLLVATAPWPTTKTQPCIDCNTGVSNHPGLFGQPNEYVPIPV